MPETILIVGGGLLLVPVVEQARHDGLRSVVTDRDPTAPAMVCADEPVPLDIYDVEGHVRLARDLAWRGDLRGVFSAGADVEVTVAAAAAAAKLPGIPVDAALDTKNKARMRRCFDQSALPNPAWAEVDSVDKAEKEAAAIGYPCMVKAVDNCASRGTSRADSVADVRRQVPEAISASTTGTALLEGCYVGEEQSCELLFDGGRARRLNIVDRIFDRTGGYAIELGHVNPTHLGRSQQAALFDLTEQAAAATGVSFGAFKADTIWTREGPKILEVTARLSGGFDSQYTTPLATGRNFIRAAMRVALGQPVDERDLTPTQSRHAAAWASFPAPGVVRDIGRIDDVRRMPGVEEVFVRVVPGERILPYRDCAARPAFVITVGDSYDHASERARAAAAALSFNIKSDDEAV